MSVYTVEPHGDGCSFDVKVVGQSGARHTILGFCIEAEAEAWIESDKRFDNSTPVDDDRLTGWEIDHADVV
jgi:hypothetical protein